MGMTFLVAAVLFLATAILLPVVQDIVKSEVKGWMPRFTDAVLESALKPLPPKLRATYAEEWRSLLGDLPTDFSRLLCAVGLRWAALRMCFDLSQSLKFKGRSMRKPPFGGNMLVALVFVRVLKLTLQDNSAVIEITIQKILRVKTVIILFSGLFVSVYAKDIVERITSVFL